MPEIVTSTSTVTGMSRLDFLKKLTFEERVAIEAAAESDPEIRVVKQSLLAAEEVRLDDPEMVAGMALYASKGLITEDRMAEILGS